MERYCRQFIFLIYTLLLRWPVWLLIWLVGQSGIFKTIFLIYPTDVSECLDFCPDIKWLRKFFSGRPTPAGLIMKGCRPIGIYLVIPNSAMELMRKKERTTVETIIKRLLWVQKLSGAQAIGLAGQLGPIFEKRHGFVMAPPFYSSTYGNIFSIQQAIGHLAASAAKKPWQASVSIIGGGLLGEQLEQALSHEGYRLSMIDVRYSRKGDISVADEQEAAQQLSSVDYAINLLPRGKDFLDCRLHRMLPETATIIDFSRPPIPPQAIDQKVVMGNRVQRRGIHFFSRLPGGWQRHELPACSMPALLASLGRLPVQTLEEFRLAARHLQFQTALATEALRPAEILWPRKRGFASLHRTIARLMLFVLKS